MEFLLKAGDRHFFIFARDKNKKDHKKLRRKLVDQDPKQGDHKQRTLKHRNKQSKHVFPIRSAKMIDGTEKPKIPSKFAKRDAQYNEFSYKSVTQATLHVIPG